MIAIKSSRLFTLRILSLSVFVVTGIYGCGQQSNQKENEENQEAVSIVKQEPRGLVAVKAVGLTLEAPDKIPSGWTTLRFDNTTDMIHFAYLYKLPEGIGIDDHKEVAAIFQNFMDDFNGNPRSEPEAGIALPEWFGNVVATGGPGLISPRRVAETTVYMNPGIYLMECYVKTDGIFHSYNSSPTQHGMVHEFTVTEEDNLAQAPMPTISINVSGEEGMTVVGDVSAGSQVVGVNFADQKPHENFLGHDVHLARIEDNTNLEELINWMDWIQPTGLQTPAPAEFLGGTHEMPAGEMAYFAIELEPGNYAWISEVPNALEKGLLVEFEVAGAQ